MELTRFCCFFSQSVIAGLTTALLIGVIPTVVVAVTSPHRKNAVSLFTLKLVASTRWRSCVREAVGRAYQITFTWSKGL